MDLLDVRTVVFTSVFFDVVCTAVIVLLWRQSRGRFAGTAFWVADYVLQTIALVLILLRGGIADWISVVSANVMVIAGGICGYLGLARFVGRNEARMPNALLLLAFTLVHIHFTFIRPDLAARNVNLAGALFMVCAQCAWLMLRGTPSPMRRFTSGVGVVFAGFCLVSVVRIILNLAGIQPNQDWFQFHLIEILSFIAYQSLLVLLAYGLVLMVNKRLILEVQTQEEKFSKAFHSSPYAIALTRLSDGRIFEVNEGFVRITGYDPGEVIGKTTFETDLWVRGKDRDSVVQALERDGRVKDRELSFRKKSGEKVTGLFSAEIITIDGERCILSSIADITERKRMEEEVRALAITDPLTGLYNRRGFVALAQQQMRIAERTGKGLLLFYLDVDGMKQINDRFGHGAGDRALVETAGILRDVFRESDVLARIGGDEFAVLALDASPEFAAMLRERLRQRLSLRPGTDAGSYTLGMSIGMARYDPASPASLDMLMSQADAAMYRQKAGKTP